MKGNNCIVISCNNNNKLRGKPDFYRKKYYYRDMGKMVFFLKLRQTLI